MSAYSTTITSRLQCPRSRSIGRPATRGRSQDFSYSLPFAFDPLRGLGWSLSHHCYRIACFHAPLTLSPRLRAVLARILSFSLARLFLRTRRRPASNRYPKNSNPCPGSRQSPTCVLAGCSFRPASSVQARTTSRAAKASSRVRHRITESSAYRTMRYPWSAISRSSGSR